MVMVLYKAALAWYGPTALAHAFPLATAIWNIHARAAGQRTILGVPPSRIYSPLFSSPCTFSYSFLILWLMNLLSKFRTPAPTTQK